MHRRRWRGRRGAGTSVAVQIDLESREEQEDTVTPVKDFEIRA